MMIFETRLVVSPSGRGRSPTAAHLRFRPFRGLLACLLLAGLAASLPAQSSGNSTVRWHARPGIAAYGVPTDPTGSTAAPLSWDDRVRLSLLTSGVAPSGLAPYLARINTLVKQARAATQGLAPAAMADRLLQFLHSGTFKNYEFYQTRVDVLLDTGTFNCVSSAIVYNLLAEALGLQTAAVSTTDHAFSQIILPNRRVDVETTSALGFDPGQKREFHDAFGKLTGFAYVPPGNYAKRTPIDDRGLAALILQNLMTEAQSHGDNVTPVGLAWDVRALEGSSADTLVLHAYQNYLVGLNNNHEYLKGLDVLRRLESILGKSGQADRLVAAFAGNLIVTRTNAGDFTGARAAAARWGDRTNRTRAEWSTMILKAQAQREYQAAGWAATLKWLAGYGSSNPQDVAGLRVNLTLQELQKRMTAGNWSATLSFWTSLPADLKSDPQIAKLGDVLSHNASVDYHNRFAQLMNRGRTTEAKAVLQEGLSRFPNSRLLLRDSRQLAARGQ